MHNPDEYSNTILHFKDIVLTCASNLLSSFFFEKYIVNQLI